MEGVRQERTLQVWTGGILFVYILYVYLKSVIEMA